MKVNQALSLNVKLDEETDQKIFKKIKFKSFNEVHFTFPIIIYQVNQMTKLTSHHIC